MTAPANFLQQMTQMPAETPKRESNFISIRKGNEVVSFVPMIDSLEAGNGTYYVKCRQLWRNETIDGVIKNRQVMLLDTTAYSFGETVTDPFEQLKEMKDTLPEWLQKSIDDSSPFTRMFMPVAVKNEDGTWKAAIFVSDKKTLIDSLKALLEEVVVRRGVSALEGRAHIIEAKKKGEGKETKYSAIIDPFASVTPDDVLAIKALTPLDITAEWNIPLDRQAMIQSIFEFSGVELPKVAGDLPVTKA